MLKIEHNIVITKVASQSTSTTSTGDKVVNSRTYSTYELTGFKSVSIEEDNDNLTNTALIVIPYLSEKSGNIDKGKMTTKDGSLFYLMGEDNEVEFMVGDTISIELYYNGKRDYKKQFIGYISAIKNVRNEYVEIHCEDFMWLFKNTKIKYSTYSPAPPPSVTGTVGRLPGTPAPKIIEDTKVEDVIIALQPNTNLSDLVKYMINEAIIKYAIPNLIDYSFIYTTPKILAELDLGKFRTNTYQSISEILTFIKDNYGFYFFTRNEYTKVVPTRVGDTPAYKTTSVLYGGFRYPLESNNETNSEYSKTIKLSDYGYTKGANIAIDSSFSDKYFNKANDLIVLMGSKDSKGVVSQVATIDGKTTISDSAKINEAINQGRPYKVEINIDTLATSSLAPLCLEKWNKFELNDNESTVITLGLPIVRQGDIAEVGTNKYYINRVLTQCDESNGFIQTLTLGGKLN